MAGLDRNTGRPLEGWPHVVQSLTVLVTTEIGERVERRAFGSRSGDLLDRPGSEPTILDHFAAIAEAIEPRLVNGFQYGEPRFDLARIIPTGGPDGVFGFELIGLYYPRGHLGDFTVFETARADVIADQSVS